MSNEDIIRQRAAANKPAASASTIAKYETDSGEVVLTPEVIRRYLVSGDASRVTDAEVVMFLNLCRYQRLNPFLREAYLIRYGEQPATIVTGKDVFTKRAAKHPLFDGFEAGLTLKVKDGSVQRREGALVLEGEVIIGGWARVYIKGQRSPIFTEASWSEYARYKKDGTLQSTWKSLGATMMRKVALVQALREAFPEDFQGLYSAEEMPIDSGALPTEAVRTEVAPAPADTPVEVVTEEGEIIEASEAEVVDDGVNDTEEAAPDLKVLAALTFPNGKHGGSTLGHVVKTDMGYAEWWVANKPGDLADALKVLIPAWKEHEVAASEEGEQLPIGGVVAEMLAAGAEVVDEDGGEG